MRAISDGCRLPCLCLRDFNVEMHQDERICNTLASSEAIADFATYLQVCNLADLPSIDSYFIWWTKQEDDEAVWCKLGQVLCNDTWFLHATGIDLHFGPQSVFDLSIIMVTFKDTQHRPRGCFKYLNVWVNTSIFKALRRIFGIN